MRKRFGALVVGAQAVTKEGGQLFEPMRVLAAPWHRQAPICDRKATGARA
jgi:hypothetical protein